MRASLHSGPAQPQVSGLTTSFAAPAPSVRAYRTPSANPPVTAPPLAITFRCSRGEQSLAAISTSCAWGAKDREPQNESFRVSALRPADGPSRRDPTHPRGLTVPAETVPSRIQNPSDGSRQTLHKRDTIHIPLRAREQGTTNPGTVSAGNTPSYDVGDHRPLTVTLRP